MKRKTLLMSLLAGLALAVLAGCSTLAEKQGEWIFQPSDRSWSGGVAAAEGMQDVWIEFDSSLSGKPAKLHGLWHAADDASDPRKPPAPLLLYLHGARWNVVGSAQRVRRMQELGFSVLAVDYRGFGKSDASLPSETQAYEDARAAWDWLAVRYPDQPRYIFGHSLGGAIAIELASRVSDEAGTIVEGTFTSIPDVFETMAWGWLPVTGLITQRFESVKKVAGIGSPLLVVHGENDRLIKPELGRKLFDAATGPKAFVLVPGGSHHKPNAVGQPLYRDALAQLFELR
jgi:alpha-beta hydrolase superfamily lysophospholipase